MEQIRLSRVDGGAVLNCAVRYAMGRKTYMPELVVQELIPVLPQCDDRTLYVFYRDVTEYLSGLNVAMLNPGWDSEDRRLWNGFLSRVKKELELRDGQYEK